MHAPSAITFLVCAMTSFSAATSTGCNSTGQQASRAVRDAMMEDSTLEAVCSSLLGEYAGGERRYSCLEVGGNKYDFTLHYHKSGTREMYLSECLDGMKKQINCERGGTTKYGNWQYRADYNKGSCMQPIFQRDVSAAVPVEFRA